MTRKTKGPDNNRRLAELEAQEARRHPKDDGPEHAAYEQGRAARRSRISREEPPHGDGPLLKAWLKGYDFEEKNGG